MDASFMSIDELKRLLFNNSNSNSINEEILIPIHSLVDKLQTDLLMPVADEDQLVHFNWFQYSRSNLTIITILQQMIIRHYGTRDKQIRIRSLLRDADLWDESKPQKLQQRHEQQQNLAWTINPLESHARDNQQGGTASTSSRHVEEFPL